MCIPAAAAVYAAQVAMQLAGQRAETKAQVAMYRDQEKAARANEEMSRKRQEQIAEEYGREEGRLRNQMKLVAGQQAAEGGAAGLAMGGSLMDVLSASYGGYLADKEQLLENQRRDTYSEFTRGWQYGQEAKQAKAGARYAKQAGRRKMFSTILGVAQDHFSGELGNMIQGGMAQQGVASSGYMPDYRITSTDIAGSAPSWHPLHWQASTDYTNLGYNRDFMQRNYGRGYYRPARNPLRKLRWGG